VIEKIRHYGRGVGDTRTKLNVHIYQFVDFVTMRCCSERGESGSNVSLILLEFKFV